MIAVVVKGRPSLAVLADMIDGVVVANHLSDTEAAELRDRLWGSVSDLVTDDGDGGSTATVRSIRAA